MNDNLQGAILIIGSLLWEDEHNAVNKDIGKLRKHWRSAHLNLSQTSFVKCPIRYGRESSTRFNTFTMVFSNSCPAKGTGALVPLNQPISKADNFKELYSQALELALAEGLRNPTQSRTYNGWGAVALGISPKLKKEKPEIAASLLAFWTNLHAHFSNVGYSLESSEKAVVTNQGLIDIDFDWSQCTDMPDFILCTPTMPNNAIYPSADNIARAMRATDKQYFTYFVENLRHKIRTYQDNDIRKHLPIDIQTLVPEFSGPINFEDYDPIIGQGYFMQDLIEALGDNLFVGSYLALCHNILKSLDYTSNLSAIPNVEEITEIISKLLPHFEGYFKNNYIIIENTGNPLQDLVRQFLDLGKLPGPEKAMLEKIVMKDLKKRADKISFYEEYPFIKKILTKEAKGNTQEDMMLQDFYQRNIDERNKVLRHLLYGIKERTIYKCQIRTAGSLASQASDSYYDRPYFSAFPFSENYFDHRKIDLARHRLHHVPFQIPEANDLLSLYSHDKKAFYRTLLTRCSIENAFDDIFRGLQFLSQMLGHRESLMRELRALSHEQKWFSFYALALSQIEGIFSEMVALVSPKKKFSSLPYKVEAVRSAYQYSTSYFDYFQYHIPVLRNKFMHSGWDEISEIKCYDLLFDIRYLLIAFQELQTPIIQANTIISSRNILDFADLAGFNAYFRLLDDLHKLGQYDQLKDKIEEFERSFLTPHTSLEDFAAQLNSDIEGDLETLYIHAYEFATDNGWALNLYTASIQDLQKADALFRIEQILHNTYNTFDRLLSYIFFLEKQNTYLPNLSIPVKENFTTVSNKFQEDFKKIKFIEQKLKPVFDQYRNQ